MICMYVPTTPPCVERDGRDGTGRSGSGRCPVGSFSCTRVHVLHLQLIKYKLQYPTAGSHQSPGTLYEHCLAARRLFQSPEKKQPLIKTIPNNFKAQPISLPPSPSPLPPPPRESVVIADFSLPVAAPRLALFLHFLPPFFPLGPRHAPLASGFNPSVCQHGRGVSVTDELPVQ